MSLKFKPAILAIASLNLRAGTQFRENLNEDAIKEYTQIVKDAVEKSKADKKPFRSPLPPIQVYRTKEKGDIPIDGFHRIKAHKNAKLDEIEVDLKEGTFEEAFEAALQANAKHGVQLTSKDSLNKMLAALKFPKYQGFSNGALAKLIGRSEFFVRSNRPLSATPKGEVTSIRKGKEVKVKTGKIGRGKDKSKGKDKSAKSTPANVEVPDDEKELLGVEPGPAPGPQEPVKESKLDTKTEKALNKVITALNGHGFDGAQVGKSIKDGSLKISSADIQKWAATSEERIRQIGQLVINNRWTVGRAVKFIDDVPNSGTKVESLINLSVAKRGLVIEKIDGYHILVAPVKGYDLLRNYEKKIAKLVPTGTEDEIE